MGVQRIQSSPAPAYPASLGEGPGHYGVAGKTSAFDTFQLIRTQPNIRVSGGDIFKQIFFHPFQTIGLIRHLGKGSRASGEGVFERVFMYRALKKALNREGNKQLKGLLKSGALTENGAENGHSTLYHLYAILTTQRAQGLDNRKVLAQTVRLLNKPYLITQKFAPLSEKSSKELLRVRNTDTAQGLNRAGVMPVVQPLSWQDIDVKNSATCVSSSVMYYMADKNPSELTRHLNELTSPMLAFQEKAKLEEISPQDPSRAYEILDAYKIKYKRSGPDEVTVKVELPPAGVVRMINAAQNGGKGGARTGIESAYQSALSFMATARSYDPATDDQASEYGDERSPGLTEEQKTIMETIIKDNGGVSSVTYQVAAGKGNPAAHEQGLPFLYGYTRTFEQTTQDIIDALNQGEFVIIGITDTDQSGAIIGGHEITITSAFADPRDGEIKFMVVDSDDDIPTPVVRSARDLIPRIHHAGMPLKLAQKIQAEIEQTPGYFVPSPEDQAHFNPISRTQDPLPPDAFGVPETPEPAGPPQGPAPHRQPMVTAPANQAQPTGPVIEYVPVYTMPYYNYNYGPFSYYGYPQASYYPISPQQAWPAQYTYPGNHYGY